ncbi:MAG: 3'(2'),5'-bisphosphate nucleotidase CysQ [Caldilineae bacterium]|nr:3'(2'),5'-bisphosphate nucleotidase CysQ [Anaerolineae bacterium]MCB9154646.1 3'(2'),5'-bisphosphate nucleotidase CysQ [Caldilineae bacterium]
MQLQSLVENELPLVEQLVREAGALVRNFYENGVEVAWKGVNDPVTAADHAANAHLVAGLRAAFPEDGILAEESADNAYRLNRKRVWIVDPLDGTKEFIGKIGEFAVMVGLAVDGAPVLGVVYQPVADVLYRGVPGEVAEVVTQGKPAPLAVSDVSDTAAMRLVASRSHRDPLVSSVCAELGITRDRPSGSVGLKVGLLATAVCDLYIHPSPGLKEWDTCAPEAILRAAGGAISDSWGNPLQYNKADVRQRQGLVASNGRLQSEIVSATARAAEAAGYRSETGFW